jgi:hypothetical protein
MKAYLFIYKHADSRIGNSDTEHFVWKIAKDRSSAMRFILQSIPRKIDESTILIMKRGLRVRMKSIEEYEVSEQFKISKI